MVNASYFSEKELNELGIKKFGSNVLISRYARIYHPDLLQIGDNVRIDDFCTLSGNIVLGSHIHIAAFVSLWGGDAGIKMEDFTGISSKSSIYAVSDDFTGLSLPHPIIPKIYKPVMIEGTVCLKRHSIVGASSVVLPNVTLGEGVAVGAMSLVTKSLEPWFIYYGVPAVKVKPRHKDLLKLEKMFLDDKKI